MTDINHSRHLPFTATQMYALVSDIEKYPEFLPYCTGLNVQSDQTRGNKRIRTAEMQIGYKLIKESFTSRVLEDPDARVISTSLVSGPFSQMENKWEFMDAENGGCDLTFSMQYSFSSRIFEKIVGAAFDRFFNVFAQSFEERAHAIYGIGSDDAAG